jgi:hypothetical protein
MAEDFDEEKHPRDENGRFASGSIGAWMHRTLGEHLTQTAAETGGFSYRPGNAASERVPTTGYMVSLPPGAGLNHVVDIKELAASGLEGKALEREVSKRVEAWLSKAVPAVDQKSEHYLGGWLERHNGGAVAFHLDVSQRFTDKDAAVKAGRERNQLAIWHIDGKREIDTGGTGR